MCASWIDEKLKDPAFARVLLEESAKQISNLEAELDRRKGDSVTRLHNICEGIGEEADKSAFSREEWDRIDKENLRLTNWVKDLQSGLYINCVYCGHRYGPNTVTPTSMADVLKKHIEECPHHPLRAAIEREEALCNLLQRGLNLRRTDEFRVADWYDDVNGMLNARKRRKEKEMHEEEVATLKKLE